jgi:hypothetical protein
VRCFFDEHSLEVGDFAAGKMLNAMEEATYGIIILSPGFFERAWCMKELETFVRRVRLVLIFYGTFKAVEDARRAAIREEFEAPSSDSCRPRPTTAMWRRPAPCISGSGWRKRNGGARAFQK